MSSTTEKHFERTCLHKLARFYLKNELKILYVSLVLYLCAGAFLFDLLEHSSLNNRTASSQSQPKNASYMDGSKLATSRVGSKHKSLSSLEELRLKSARRMWNITNQLNILYESNWTRLIVEELEAFESNVLELSARLKSMDEESQDRNSLNTRSANRYESFRLRLLHCLSIVSTMSSPLGLEHLRQDAGYTNKLATLLYTSLGVPLFFYTILLGGCRLHRLSPNLLLRFTHYCLLVPAHLVQLCVHWFCCCYCCCCYCCGSISSRKRQKLLCFRIKPKGVKLQLWSADSVSAREQTKRQPTVAPRMQASGDKAAQTIRDEDKKAWANCQKSVRFSPTQQTMREQDLGLLNQQEILAGCGVDPNGPRLAPRHGLERHSLVSMLERKFCANLMSAILTLLLVYLLLGAFAYSNRLDRSYVDALLSVVAFISTSEFLPYSTSHRRPQNNSTHHSQPNGDPPASKQSDQLLVSESSVWSATFECLYLVGGLNLVVSALNLARISLDNWRRSHLADGDLAPIEAPKCNGHLSSLVGSLDHSAPAALACAPSAVHSTFEPEALEVIRSPMTPTGIHLNDDLNGHQFIMQPNQATATISSATSTASTQHQQSQRQAQPQSAYNLTELFVVSQEPSHHHHHHLHHRHTQLSRHDDPQAQALSADSHNGNTHDQFNYIQTLTNQPSDLSLTISSTDQSICTHINNNNNSARIYQQHHSNMGPNSNCQLVGSLNGRQDSSVEVERQILYEEDSNAANNPGVIDSKLDVSFGLMNDNASNYSILSQGAPSLRRKHSDFYLENGVSCGHQVATLGRKRITENKRQNGSNQPKELGSFANPKSERHE